MNVKQEGPISTLSVKPRKLVDQFTYLGSRISSVKGYVNIRLEKACSTIKWLWKSNISDKIKQGFFPAGCVFVITNMWMHFMDASVTHEE